MSAKCIQLSGGRREGLCLTCCLMLQLRFLKVLNWNLNWDYSHWRKYIRSPRLYNTAQWICYCEHFASVCLQRFNLSPGGPAPYLSKKSACLRVYLSHFLAGLAASPLHCYHHRTGSPSRTILVFPLIHTHAKSIVIIILKRCSIPTGGNQWACELILPMF